MAPTPFAVIAGIGPGTGASVARRFAQDYPVALLARKPESYTPLMDEINKSGGKAIGISTDVADETSVKKAFEQITATYGSSCAAAIFNASGGFHRQPFLELKESQLMSSIDVSV